MIAWALDSVFAQLYAEQFVWGTYHRKPCKVVVIYDLRDVYEHRSFAETSHLGARLQAAVNNATRNILLVSRLGTSLPEAGEPVDPVPVVEVEADSILMCNYETPFGLVRFGWSSPLGLLVVCDPRSLSVTQD